MKIELLNIPKDDLLDKLKAIQKLEWVHTNRSKNDGAVGNTLEDLLEIPENNLGIANTVDWELKAQRKKTGSMITLFHTDPLPILSKCLHTSNIFLPLGQEQSGLYRKSNRSGEVLKSPPLHQQIAQIS